MKLIAAILLSVSICFSQSPVTIQVTNEVPVQIGPLTWGLAHVPVNGPTCTVNGKIETLSNGIAYTFTGTMWPNPKWDSLKWTNVNATILCSYEYYGTRTKAKRRKIRKAKQ